MLQPGDKNQSVDVCSQSRPMSQGLGGQEQGSHHLWPWVSLTPARAPGITFKLEFSSRSGDSES